MQDGIIKGLGNSRWLKSSIGNTTTWQQFLASLIAGTLPIDLSGINEDGWDQLGTPLNKATLLSDSTETEIFGSTQDRTVDDAFMGIWDRIEQIFQEVSNMFQISSYVGTGGEGARTLNFNQTPLMVLILGENGGYAIFLAGAEGAYSTNGSSNNLLTTTWTGASLRYTGASATQLMNVSGVTYQVIAFVPITSGE